MEKFKMGANYIITKIHFFKYIENFATKQINFQTKISDIFTVSSQNISEAVLTSNHNLCFWADIRKIMYTLC